MGHREMKSVQVSTLVVLLLGLITVRVWTHNICVQSEEKSSYNEYCEESHPLKWFVNNTVGNHSIIFFLPGTHYLNSSETNRALIVFDKKYNLSLTGSQYGGKPNYSIVLCNGNQSGFFFNDSTDVCITNLEFQGCSANMKLTAHENISFGGVFFHLSYNITISHVCIRHSKGYGLHMDDVCGKIVIDHSHFVANKNGNIHLSIIHCLYNTQTTVTIKYTQIQDSNDKNAKDQNAKNAGLCLWIHQPHIRVTLTNLMILNNSGKYGGNMQISITDFGENTSSVSIENTNISYGHAKSGGGIGVIIVNAESLNKRRCDKKNQNRLLILKNTTITNNIAKKSGGGIIFAYDERKGLECTTRLIKIANCTISRNKAIQGSALEITKHNLPMYDSHYVPQLLINISDSIFANNCLANGTVEQINKEGIVESFSVENLVLQNTIFRNNNGTALMLVNSGAKFVGNVTFENNSGHYGGAIKICDSSQIYFNNETRVRFLNNSATYTGGAIYVGTQCPTETPPCFFQVSDHVKMPIIKDLAKGILYFEGNHARTAGHAIYGGLVDHCFTDRLLRFNSSNYTSYYSSFELYNHTFEFSNYTEPSLVTSDPYGICLCNYTNDIDCKIRTYSVHEIYPGEDFSVYLTAVGQTNGTVPASIHTEQNQMLPRICVNMKNNIEETNASCSNVTMNIQKKSNSPNDNINFMLKIYKTSLEGESNYYRLHKLRINATLKPCPFLFELDTNNGICDCYHQIKELVNCDINKKTVNLKLPKPSKDIDNGTWISCHNSSVTGNCTKIEWSKYCQRGHCSNNESINFDQYNLHEYICTTGREGKLCGKCNDNYTLSLGTSKCIQTEEHCHAWNTFLLIIVFILFGLSLVCFVTIFNITVAEGTVHGPLLYANCIQVIQYSLFNGSVKIPFAIALISWPNLDFGFEICFYSGMTAYQKIWLEFGFLLYLLLLGVMIVCLSRRFVWFTRLAGRNVVPVLATIVFISYPKLVKNSLRVWDCHQRYNSSDNHIPYVWYMDETVECFKEKHLVLFIASIPLFLMACFYMFCFLFIQCLQRRSNWFILRWVNKLRPFFDAHTGPCHDHYRFWPGLLLFVKMIMYIASWKSYTLVEEPSAIGGLCIVLFFFACIFPRGVYKSWPLNILDFSFILNLGMIAITVIAGPSEEHYIAGWISLSIAVLTFTLILAYHSFKRVKKTRCWKKISSKTKLRRNIQQINESDETSPLIQEQCLPKVIQFISLREPLLEDD